MKWKLLSLTVGLMFIPWSLYLTYLILLHVNADSLMWFLFYLMVPMALLSGILSRLAEWEEKE